MNTIRSRHVLRRDLPAAAVVNLLLWLFTLLGIFPLVWMAYSSLKTGPEFARSSVALPGSLQFANFTDAFQAANLSVGFQNSLFVSVLSVTGILAGSFLIGYGISRFDFAGRSVVRSLLLAGMLIPIHSLLIPLFLVMRDLGLYNTRITLIPPYIAFGLPLATFLFAGFLPSVPRALEEAAYIDGASIPYTALHVILPLCRPVAVTAMVISFLFTWNEFVLALVLLRDPDLLTIPVGLTNLVGQYSSNYPELLAALLMATLPVLLLYAVLGKYVMQGMTAGAVKG